MPTYIVRRTREDSCVVEANSASEAEEIAIEQDEWGGEYEEIEAEEE